jgi:archaellum component FlaF (FlaF/FlaG flagellin family)
MDFASVVSAACAVSLVLIAVGTNLVRIGQLTNKVTNAEIQLASMEGELERAKMATVALAAKMSTEYVQHSTMEKLETSVNVSITRLFDRMDNGFNQLGNRIDNLLQAKPNA